MEKDFNVSTGVGAALVTGGIDSSGYVYLVSGVWSSGPYAGRELDAEELEGVEECQTLLKRAYKSRRGFQRVI